eukprot:2202289-Pleurochrysis_carterae.AAC.1
MKRVCGERITSCSSAAKKEKSLMSFPVCTCTTATATRRGGHKLWAAGARERVQSGDKAAARPGRNARS